MAIHRKIIPGLLCLLTVAAVGNAGAQDAPAMVRATVTVTVVDQDTGDPIAGVVVHASGLDLQVTTDATGQFVLDAVPLGLYALQLSHQEYDRVEGDLRIDQSGEFVLSMLPTVSFVEGMLTGIAGVVTDQEDGRPIPEVVVSVADFGQVTRTDARGHFVLPELLPGRYAVEFSHLGYVGRSDSASVGAGRVTNLRTVLSVEPIELRPIEVSVERRDLALQEAGFYERERDGWGHFVDRHEIEMWAHMDVTDALTRFVGVRIVSDPSSPSSRSVMFRRLGGLCRPVTYLDGVRIRWGINDIVSPQSVAGVELYRGTAGVPPQYMGVSAGCGVMLVWTRRGS